MQIHCQLHTDENKITINKDDKLLKEDQVQKSNNLKRGTSFHPLKGERGQVVFSTKPTFLFCDLKLKSKESQLFHFSDRLPDYSPPSFNGNAIKYFYKIIIGIQRVNSPIQFLRMPLKVLNIPSIDKQADDQLNETQNSSNLTSLSDVDVLDCASDEITNFQIKQNEIINVILHKLDCLSSKRNLSSYIITNHLGGIGKFYIFKSIFKLGEDITGYFDFSDGEIPCVQFTVTLQSEEIVNENCRSTKLIKKGSQQYSPHLTNYNQCQEFCIHSQNSQINLPIPLTITPSFETKLVHLRWRLYFEFVTTRPEEVIDNNEIYEDMYGQLELSPKELNVQTMIWELPITILPTNPSKIGQGLQLPDTSIIIV